MSPPLAAALSARRLPGFEPARSATPPSDESAIAPILTGADAVDIHSYAKPLEARVTHVALDLNVDFTAKRVGGTATLDVDAKPDAKQIILDDKGLEIESIADASGKPLAYTRRRHRPEPRRAAGDRRSARRGGS